MSKAKIENRYLVLSRAKMELYLSTEMLEQIDSICNELERSEMEDKGDSYEYTGDIECLVVKKKWPIYRQVEKIMLDWLDTLESDT